MKLHHGCLAAVLLLTGACDDGSRDQPDDPVDKAPVAVTNGDQTVTEGATVTLDGSSSTDGDTNIGSYTWTQTRGPAVPLGGAAAAVATFVAPDVGDTTIFRFDLTVTDATGLSDTATVTVTVVDLNPAPWVDAGTNQSADARTSVTLAGTATDDSAVASVRWNQVSGPDAGDITNADQATATFTTPDVDQMRTLAFELVATDDQGKTGSDTVEVTVAPVVAGIAFVQQPTSPPRRNAIWSEVEVNVLNASGERLVGGEAARLAITLTASLETAGTDVTADLGGTLTAAAVTGRASFRDLTYPHVTAANEAIVLTASAAGVTPVDSTPVAVVWPSQLPGTLTGDIDVRATAFAGGDIMMAGRFAGTVDFDFAGAGEPSSIRTATGYDGFVARYSGTGELRWVEAITSSQSAVVTALTAATDSILVAVNYGTDAEVIFPHDQTPVVVPTQGGDDAAFAELDAGGVTQWAGAIQGSGDEYALALAVDGAGNPVLGGHFAGTDTDFDPDPDAQATALSSSAGTDGFLLRLDGGGGYEWHAALDLSNGSLDQVTALAHQGSSRDVIAAGRTADDAFIVRLDADDAEEKVNVTFGGSGPGDIASVQIREEGSSKTLYLAGIYEGEIDFDPDEVNETVLDTGGPPAIFVARYDMAGMFSWVREVSGGSASVAGLSVRSDDLVIGGTGDGTVTFEPSGAAETISFARATPFVATFALSSGNLGWVEAWDDNPLELNTRAFADSGSRLLLTGTMAAGTVDLDPGDTVVEVTLPSPGIWAVKLDQAAAVVP